MSYTPKNSEYVKGFGGRRIKVQNNFVPEGMNFTIEETVLPFTSKSLLKIIDKSPNNLMSSIQSYYDTLRSRVNFFFICVGTHFLSLSLSDHNLLRNFSSYYGSTTILVEML